VPTIANRVNWIQWHLEQHCTYCDAFDSQFEAELLAELEGLFAAGLSSQQVLIQFQQFATKFAETVPGEHTGSQAYVSSPFGAASGYLDQLEYWRVRTIRPARRVKLGAKLLDEVVPGWEAKINVGILILDTDVITQLFPSHTDARARKRNRILGTPPRDSNWWFEHGFVDLYFQSRPRIDFYRRLNRLWHAEVMQRRTAAALLAV
jgi:hypothetical protein